MRVDKLRASVKRWSIGGSVALVRALAACGGSSTGGGSASQRASQATAVGATIKLGVLGDFTGETAPTGADMRLGTDLAVQQINAAGGINRRPLVADYVDPKGDPAEALTLAQPLVQQDRVDALIGGVLSSECLGVEKLAPKLSIVYLALAGCANEDFTAKDCNKYAFRTDPVGRQQSIPLAGYLVKTFGKRWVMLYPDYAFGQSQLQAYSTALEQVGGSVTVKVPIPQGGKNDAPYVTKIPLDGSVDGVIASFGGGDTLSVLSALSQFGISSKLPIVGVASNGYTIPDAANGGLSIASLPQGQPPADDVLATNFYTAFKSLAVKESDVAKILGTPSEVVPADQIYVAFTAIAALKQAMVAAHFTGKADTDKLIAAFEGLKASKSADFPGGDFVMNKADHQGALSESIVKIDGQKQDVLTTIPAAQIPPIGDCHV